MFTMDRKEPRKPERALVKALNNWRDELIAAGSNLQLSALEKRYHAGPHTLHDWLLPRTVHGFHNGIALHKLLSLLEVSSAVSVKYEPCRAVCAVLWYCRYHDSVYTHFQYRVPKKTTQLAEEQRRLKEQTSDAIDAFRNKQESDALTLTHPRSRHYFHSHPPTRSRRTGERRRRQEEHKQWLASERSRL